MGATDCGNKNECCCCCKISLGIKFLGGWLIIELLLLLLNSGNIPESPIFAVFSVIEILVLAVNVVCFIWSMCKEDDVKPREYWLKAFILHFVLFLILNLVGIAYYNLGEVASDTCEAEGEKLGWKLDEDGDWVSIDGDKVYQSPMIYTHEECVAA